VAKLAGNILPDSRSVAQALLHFLRLRSRPMEPSEIYDPLAEMMRLTPAQLRLKRRTRPTESAWNNRVQTARELLVRDGLIIGTRHGFWSLTETGRHPRDLSTLL
jgi:restriction endonuclease Mrr